MQQIKKIVDYISNPDYESPIDGHLEETFYLRWAGFDLTMTELTPREVKDYPEKYPNSSYLTYDDDSFVGGYFLGTEKAYYRGNKGHLVLIESDLSGWNYEENPDAIDESDDYYTHLSKSRLNFAVTEFFGKCHGTLPWNCEGFGSMDQYPEILINCIDELVKNPHAIVLYQSVEDAGGFMFIINDEVFYQEIESLEPDVPSGPTIFQELEPTRTYDLVKKYISENIHEFKRINTCPYTHVINR